MINSPATSTLNEVSPLLWARRAFEKQLLNVVPDMRAFARFLARNPTDADDLVQDAVVRALRSYHQFDLGTNMKSWAFTIVRNTHLNGLRRRRYEELDDKDQRLRPISPNQLHYVELREVSDVLASLSSAHRDVLILVRASGFSYEEAAQVMKCKLGTIKSRLNRADVALRVVLGADYRPAVTLRRELSIH